MSIQSRTLFYNAYILSHLDYCCGVWGNCNYSIQEQIIRFQKKSCTIESGPHFRYAIINNELKLITFPEIPIYIYIQTAVQLRVCITKCLIAPESLNTTFICVAVTIYTSSMYHNQEQNYIEIHFWLFNLEIKMPTSFLCILFYSLTIV